MGDYIIMRRDYNEKTRFWGSRLDTFKEIELYKEIEESNCEVQFNRESVLFETKSQICLTFVMKLKIAKLHTFIEENKWH